jgi:hypothetical protein
MMLVYELNLSIITIILFILTVFSGCLWLNVTEGKVSFMRGNKAKNISFTCFVIVLGVFLLSMLLWLMAPALGTAENKKMVRDEILKGVQSIELTAQDELTFTFDDNSVFKCKTNNDRVVIRENTEVFQDLYMSGKIGTRYYYQVGSVRFYHDIYEKQISIYVDESIYDQYFDTTQVIWSKN